MAKTKNLSNTQTHIDWTLGVRVPCTHRFNDQWKACPAPIPLREAEIVEQYPIPANVIAVCRRSGVPLTAFLNALYCHPDRKGKFGSPVVALAVLCQPHSSCNAGLIARQAKKGPYRAYPEFDLDGSWGSWSSIWMPGIGPVWPPQDTVEMS